MTKDPTLRAPAAAAIALIPAILGGCARLEPPLPDTLFREPAVVRAENGVLEAELAVKYAENRIGSDRVVLRSYNGALVGPTLRLKPGDTLRLRLVNELPANPPSDHRDVNVPHDFNTTNLHTHGLHVSPSGKSDNVFLAIEPGQVQDYEIALPADHPDGTFWYHPHRHGSVALQVGSGMSGALVVEGGIDRAPELQGVAEKVFVFQQIPYERGEDGIGRIEDYLRFGPFGWEKSGRFTTVNGLVQPRLEAAPGEVQRWRFIHAGLRETITAKLVRCAEDWGGFDKGAAVALHEIAVDGITRYRMAEKERIELQPGYRSDVLVQVAEPGTYCLIDDASGPVRSLLARAEGVKLLARLRVAGPARAMALPPADLSAYAPLAPIEAGEVTGRRATEFNVVPRLSSGAEFQINGKTFDPNVVDQTLKLGAVEEWTLTSKFGSHPYHIHVNPFLVVDGAEPVWRDTIMVRKDEPIRIRTRYQRYTGKFVIHCHILDHEDRGMMEVIEVVP